jgi:Histidine phosphatase superfamily (branch 1)
MLPIKTNAYLFPTRHTNATLLYHSILKRVDNSMFRVACYCPKTKIARSFRSCAFVSQTTGSPFFSTNIGPLAPSPSEDDSGAVSTKEKSFPIVNPRFPKRIILLRHGESLGNVDESLYAEIPDWKIPLTRRGEKQCLKAATDLHALTQNESIFCYCSPYTRTKESWNLISHYLLEQGDVNVIGTREEPRIAEQQFGNFQSEFGCDSVVTPD